MHESEIDHLAQQALRAPEKPPDRELNLSPMRLNSKRGPVMGPKREEI